MRGGYIVTPDGLTLQTYSLDGGAEACGTAFVAHSQAQHSKNLELTVTGLCEKGWHIHAADLRGHGYSSGVRAPLGHMDMNAGWEKLVGDLRLALETAFIGTDWHDRMVVGPNIGAMLLLEVMKTWPDLAKYVVFCAPPPNQPKLMRLGQAFTKARALFNDAEKEDRLTQHQLYRFLGLQLDEQDRLIDVMTSDRKITNALYADPYAWPTPTTGYFHEMFRGIEQSWSWPKGRCVKQGTRALVMYGGEDPVTARGKFIESITSQLNTLGFASVDAICLPHGRSGLIIDEDRLHISEHIHRWSRGETSVDASLETNPDDLAAPLRKAPDLSTVSYDVLAQIGSHASEGIRPEDLLELCYNAVNDDRHCAEMFYHLAYEISVSTDYADIKLQGVLNDLMPHWERSYSLSQQVMQNAVVGSVLQDVIDRFGLGMAIVDNDFKVLQANARFEAALEAGFGSEPAVAISQLRDKLLHTSYSEAAEAVIVEDDVPLGFFFKPPVLRKKGLSGRGGHGVVLLQAASDEASPVDDKIELLRLAYGFTSKEAETALAIVTGSSLDTAAGQLGVSINTVRTHLKSVFSKVAVKSQAELVSRLMKGPFGLLLSHSRVAKA